MDCDVDFLRTLPPSYLETVARIRFRKPERVERRGRRGYSGIPVGCPYPIFAVASARRPYLCSEIHFGN